MSEMPKDPTPEDLRRQQEEKEAEGRYKKITPESIAADQETPTSSGQGFRIITAKDENPGLDPEVWKRLQEEAEIVRQKLWLNDHPDTTRFSGKELSKETNYLVGRIEELMASFEARLPLGELHAIVDLRPQDVERHPLREAAKAALIPIVYILNELKDRAKSKKFTKQKYEEIYEKYMHLSRAVGMINNNKVDHDRRAKPNYDY